MAITTESDIINFINKLRVGKEVLFTFTIAFNTVGFTLKDIPKIDMALKSRGFETRTLSCKLKRILYIGLSLVVANIKRIDNLNQSYHFRIGRISSKVNILELRIKKLGICKKNIASEINLRLICGKPLLLFGRTGSGKTTLCKVFAGIIPNMQKVCYSGEILLDGKKLNFTELSKKIAFSFQESEDQFILDNIEREVSFFLDDKEKKIASNLLKLFKLTHLKNKSVKDLSTGQRKIVSIISVLSQEKPIIILDEPTANLDKKNSQMLLKLLLRYKQNRILIISSHDPVFFKLCKTQLVHSKEGWILKKNFQPKKKGSKYIKHEKKDKKINEKILEVKNFSYIYPDKTLGINNLSFRINKNSITAIAGKNGSGKTTLLMQIADGKLKLPDLKTAIIMQEPDKQLFNISVKDEIGFGTPKNVNVDISSKKLGLDNVKNEHPLFISRGQKQKLLIACAVSKKPDILLIDEPFTGLDETSIGEIKEMILDYKFNNKATIIVAVQEVSYISDIIDEAIQIDNQSK